MSRDLQIDAVRRFSRFYTPLIGLLEEGYLASGFTLTEARVLYELASRPRLSAAQIADELRLDRGYLSRILKAFEARGLLARAPSPADARQAEITLTPAGRAAFAPLDAASRRQAGELLGRLAGPERDEVARAMRRIEALLGAPDGDVRLRPLVVGDIGWIARRQGMLYAAEYGWDATFEALVAEIGAAFVRTHDPARERAWIAERDGAILGSIVLVRESDDVAKLRLLYVEPEARGLGLGRRLTAECIAFARANGYRTLTLWTNDVLAAARRIYETAGFRLVAEERHRSFGQDLVGQNWNLDL